MSSLPRDRVSVDLRGLRGRLWARAARDGITPSDVVRAALNSYFSADAPVDASPTVDLRPRAGVRVNCRMTAADAEALRAAARSAGLSCGAYIAGLVAGIHALAGSAGRVEHIAALRESSAAVATLARDIHHLTALLREGAFRAAQEYRPVLETLDRDLRQHLRLAAAVLAALRPARGSTTGPQTALPENRGGVHAELGPARLGALRR